MELIRGLHNLRPQHRGCAVTIGNFDGLHLGHQALVAQLAQRARALGAPATVVLFEPQPSEYFRTAAVPPRLMRLREKLLALREQPVDRVLSVRFDAAFAAWSAEAFIERVLLQGLGARYVAVGDDFRYGRGRHGDFAMLVRAGKQHGFEVAAAPTFRIDGERVSSTRVRAALAAGDLAVAEKLLGRPYRICGRVAHGDKLGRQIGVPTANIHLHRRAAPVHGIYAAVVRGLTDAPVPAAASVGTRPTVDGTRALLEVHLLDFERDIYGAYVGVDFLYKLRDERRFDSIPEMQTQMLRDIEQTRGYFAGRGRTASMPRAC
jgi:riboflavin kinase / FMN adenylyltransferase